MVDEKVLAGLVGGDEPEALVVAEPLHCSCGHGGPPSDSCALRDTSSAGNSGLAKRGHCDLRSSGCPTSSDDSASLCRAGRPEGCFGHPERGRADHERPSATCLTISESSRCP